jgi:hypothetical protein
MRLNVVVLTILFCFASASRAATTVSGVTLAPATPNILLTNQRVNVTFTHPSGSFSASIVVISAITILSECAPRCR